jgi:hypothetical protein
VSDIVPFDDYRATVSAARPEDYAEALDAGARAAGLTLEEVRVEFEKMKADILSNSAGVHPVGSYRDTNGQVFDCIPFDQQSSVHAAHLAGHSVARTAPPPLAIGEPPAGEAYPLPVTAPKRHCPDGAVAVLRPSLDQLARYGTLENWRRKSGIRAGNTAHS